MCELSDEPMNKAKIKQAKIIMATQQTHDVETMLVQRCFNVVCLLRV